jgi:hypothetical protein
MAADRARAGSPRLPGPPARLLDVVGGRSGRYYGDWIAARGREHRSPRLSSGWRAPGWRTRGEGPSRARGWDRCAVADARLSPQAGAWPRRLARVVHTGRVLSHQWAEIPGRVRVVVALAVLVFAHGTGVHVTQVLIGGINPYPAMPASLAIYFVSLTALDPAAAVLLGLTPLRGMGARVPDHGERRAG